MTDVLMPRLSDSMEEGTIVRWLKPDGALVERGEEIAEIETDKAVVAYEAESDGRLQILVAAGETAALGGCIGRIVDPAVAVGESPAEDRPGDRRDTDAGSPAPAGESDPVRTVAAVRARRRGASPLARRIAVIEGIDLGALAGTGPGGRVVRADVERAMARRCVDRAATPTAQAAPTVAGERSDVALVEPTRIERVMARRMAATTVVPDFAVECECDLEAAVALREQLKQLAERPPSLNDFVVKACAIALREHPRLNASFVDGRFALHERVNVGVAVAGEGGLVVPTVFDADEKGLGRIATVTRELAELGRNGRLRPDQMTDATFTVSNLGMLGVDAFTAIVNAPQAGILAVGAMRARPVVVDGEVAVRRTSWLRLSCDHRLVDGAQAAEFLTRVRALLERPLLVTCQ